MSLFDVTFRLKRETRSDEKEVAELIKRAVPGSGDQVNRLRVKEVRNPAKPAPTRDIADRVVYNWYMLRGSRSLLVTDTPRYPGGLAAAGVTSTSTTIGVWRVPVHESAPGRLKRRLRIEGLLLHARVLRDFFLCDSRNPDDILAVDFLEKADNWSSDGLFGYLQANRERMDKMLAHLTYSGAEFVRTGEIEWRFDDIHDEIKAAWDRFLPCLNDERRPWFENSEFWLEAKAF